MTDLAETLESLTEARRDLAVLAHNLREVYGSISEGIAKHGAYNVPWNVLSWSKDTAERGAGMIAEIIGPVCQCCDGMGYVKNPEARYYRDNDTGFDSTNDPEEIDCPDCDGTGFPLPQPPATTQSAIDEDIAF